MFIPLQIKTAFPTNKIRTLLAVLILTAVCGGNAFADGIININNPQNPTGTESGWTWAGDSIVIHTTGNYTIFGDGTPSTNRIVVNIGDTAYITLEKVNISFEAGDKAAFIVMGQKTTVFLTLKDSNRLKSSGNNAGLGVYFGTEFFITDTSTGSLTAIGSGENNSYHAGAGIGSISDSRNGSIEIYGGTIVAIGGTGTGGDGGGGAGIGCGSNGSFASIYIYGGNITATGGYNAAGIGGGSNNYKHPDFSSYVYIHGGTVAATGGSDGIGKGGGSTGFVSGVRITGGSVKATTISSQPSNGIKPVYLNTLTIGIPAVGDSLLITAGSIDNVNCSITPNANAGVYGIKDVVTRDTGKVYFYLPVTNNALDSVELAVDGRSYGKGYKRANNHNNIDTLLLLYGISLSKSLLDFGTISCENQLAPQTQTITNIGTRPTGTLSVSLKKGDAFTLSPGTISSLSSKNESGEFTVTPKENLLPGVYLDTVTLLGSNGIKDSFAVSLTVDHILKVSNGNAAGYEWVGDTALVFTQAGAYTVSMCHYSGIDPTYEIIKIKKTTSPTDTFHITLQQVHINVSDRPNVCAFAIDSGVNVHLILKGENTLKSGRFKPGLGVPVGASLKISTEIPEEDASLLASGGACGAGIGGGYEGKGEACGSVTIESGLIMAIGNDVNAPNSASSGAGIGGGGGNGGTVGGHGGNITINGGIVTADGGGDGAGIGGGGGSGASGGGGGKITITGGKILAINRGFGAGIGGGGGAGSGEGGEITITGGNVTAVCYGHGSGAGIGSGGCTSPGFGKSGGNITISGGTVTAVGGYRGAGIGGGSEGKGGNITITGGTVTASSLLSTGSNGNGSGAGIGGGDSAGGGRITINGGNVTAIGNSGAGIGGGNKACGDTVRINGGTVEASSIGNGTNNSCASCSIIIDGGSVKTDRTSIPPKNSADNLVYLNILTLGNPNVDDSISVVAGSIDNVNCNITPNAATGVYGINDVVTRDAGKVYFYLLKTDTSQTIWLSTLTGKYRNRYIRQADNNNKDTLYKHIFEVAALDTCDQTEIKLTFISDKYPLDLYYKVDTNNKKMDDLSFIGLSSPIRITNPANTERFDTTIIINTKGTFAFTFDSLKDADAATRYHDTGFRASVFSFPTAEMKDSIEVCQAGKIQITLTGTPSLMLMYQINEKNDTLCYPPLSPSGNDNDIFSIEIKEDESKEDACNVIMTANKPGTFTFKLIEMTDKHCKTIFQDE